MAACSSALEFGAHPIMGTGYAVGVRVRVAIMVRVRVRNYGYRPGDA